MFIIMIVTEFRVDLSNIWRAAIIDSLFACFIIVIFDQSRHGTESCLQSLVENLKVDWVDFIKIYSKSTHAEAQRARVGLMTINYGFGFNLLRIGN